MLVFVAHSSHTNANPQGMSIDGKYGHFIHGLDLLINNP